MADIIQYSYFVTLGIYIAQWFDRNGEGKCEVYATPVHSHYITGVIMTPLIALYLIISTLTIIDAMHPIITS